MVKQKLKLVISLVAYQTMRALLTDSIRQHWRIENSLHWVLDVAFCEDDSRIRKDNAPQNFAVLRHIANSLLQQNKSVKTKNKKQTTKGWMGQ